MERLPAGRPLPHPTCFHEAKDRPPDRVLAS